MNSQFSDVAIVGAGPAGCAAAITCAQAGLKTVLLERRAFPRHRPGESLHPGVRPLFAQLGVIREVEAAAQVRHPGLYVSRAGGPASFTRFGEDERGVWCGYQILREQLDAILLSRAAAVGVEVRQPVAVRGILWDAGRVAGLETAAGPLEARWVINASGAGSPLRRAIPSHLERYSPPLFARYGYVAGNLTTGLCEPMLQLKNDGWEWVAKVAPSLYQWTRLSIGSSPGDTIPPEPLRQLEAVGPVRRADVTWRCASMFAAPGILQTGDAAVVLDPASGHGILRALMTGQMAAHAIAQHIAGFQAERTIVSGYQRWLANWFAHDIQRMSDMYSTSVALWDKVNNRSSK